jgi:hypothetical protein
MTSLRRFLRGAHTEMTKATFSGECVVIRPVVSPSNGIASDYSRPLDVETRKAVR